MMILLIYAAGRRATSNTCDFLPNISRTAYLVSSLLTKCLGSIE
jgi:hypothetical protein